MITDEMLMAYADGELNALEAERVEQAIAAEPRLAEQVAAQRRLRAMMGAEFDGVLGEPIPEQLRATVMPKVVPLRRPAQHAWAGWAAALAASLVFGVGLGSQLRERGAIVERGGALVAGGDLARALDTQLAGLTGEMRMLVSFRDRQDRLCRVFDTSVAAGIACREGEGWAVVRTRKDGEHAPAATYRQAGSADGALLAEAQDMMAGEPLDAAGEARARASGWRSARR